MQWVGGWATKIEQIDLDLLSCGNRRLMHFALNSRQSGLASAPTISQQAQTIRGRLKRKPLMRDTFESIDEATAADDVLREALYELAAHEIATQTLTVAAARRQWIASDEVAGRLVEEVADYPGVTGRRFPLLDKSIGQRATEILMRLARTAGCFSTPEL